ncbi:MAG: DUF2911 domain-containing protein [Bacteroidetes bacterium]|nr:DUF2911 domain-containing protein [Bacteroidota bacterium]
MYTSIYPTRGFYPGRERARLIASYFLVCAMTLLVACQTAPAKRYGFITMLGQDTISVESVVRRGKTLESEEVDRFPEVRIRHTVVKLDDDGGIGHLEMEIHTPSEPSRQRDRTVVADVGHGQVHLSKTDSSGTVNRDFPTGGSLVVAHVPQMYSLYELYFAAARKQAERSKPGVGGGVAAGNAVQLRQFYIDREFDRFPLGHATVTPVAGTKMEGNGKMGGNGETGGNGKVEGNAKVDIVHDWLAGTGEATMDSDDDMVGYSGARTTYKVRVKRLDTVPDVKSIAAYWAAKEAAGGRVRSLSVRDTVRAQIGNTMVTIDYGRPLMRGRTLLGDLIPYDRVWRTGANAATQLTTSGAIKLGGMKVPAGTCSLFTAPHASGVDLIVNKEHGEWGTDYNGSRDLGSVRMTSETAAAPVEAFTISVIAGDHGGGKLVFEWGSFRWIAPIEVDGGRR